MTQFSHAAASWYQITTCVAQGYDGKTSPRAQS